MNKNHMKIRKWSFNSITLLTKDVDCFLMPWIRSQCCAVFKYFETNVCSKRSTWLDEEGNSTKNYKRFASTFATNEYYGSNGIL